MTTSSNDAEQMMTTEEQHFQPTPTAPPGTLYSLQNKMEYSLIDLTNDPKFKGIDVIDQVLVPQKKKMAAGGSSSGNGAANSSANTNCVCFSVFCDTIEQMRNVKCRYTPMKGISDVIDGVIVDEKTIELIKQFNLDSHFETNDGGNLNAVHLMPRGWALAHKANSVCHRCGTFPALARCLRCNVATFCSNTCLAYAKHSEVHTQEVCDTFIAREVSRNTGIRVVDDDDEVMQ